MLYSDKGTIMAPLYIQLESEDVRAPARMTGGAAGYDLCSYEEISIEPGKRALVSTGLRIRVPPDTYGRVAPRSGLAVKGIDVGAGVIDADYNGLVKVLLINNSSNAFHVSKFDRIAQLLLETIKTPDVAIVKSLEQTERGENGFGSTGL